MRNLKNYDEFMDFCGDALEPIVTICADKEAAAAFREKKILKAAAIVCKKYKEETAAVLAALDGCTIEEFKASFNPVEIPAKLTAFISSLEFAELFGSAQTENEASSSGTAQEATPA